MTQQTSIRVPSDPQVQYLLRVGDTALILAQRTAEWTGHAPVLEEDIALANIGLDLLGQARGMLTRAGELTGHDEDQLAFLRDERDYRNVTLVELPRGDFAVTVLRNTIMATFFKLLWGRLMESSDAEVAAIAGKAIDEAAARAKLGPRWSELKDAWFGEMKTILDASGLAMPVATPFISTGKTGVHSEHMGYILTEMQYLQRSFPGGVW
jgi:ring-1,2-phenylacetyl-CoA epoxidase subunit PaaC